MCIADPLLTGCLLPVSLRSKSPDGGEESQDRGHGGHEAGRTVAAVFVAVAVAHLDVLGSRTLDAPVQAARAGALAHHAIVTLNVLCHYAAVDVGTIGHMVLHLLSGAVLQKVRMILQLGSSSTWRLLILLTRVAHIALNAIA